MSRDSASTITLTSKKHDIAQSVLSRKRKLCDLYAVATSTEPIPAAYDLDLDHHPKDQPLVVFLNNNDIKKGRYFRHATIPDRPRQASFLREIENDARRVTNSTSASRRDNTKSVSDAKIGSPSVGEHKKLIKDQQVDSTGRPHATGNTAESDDREHSANLTTSIDKHHKSNSPTPDSSNESGKLRRSRRSAVATEADSQSTPPTDQTKLPKPSRPESPPYSPDSEALTGVPRVDEEGLDTTHDASANVLTPGKDENEDVTTNEDQSREERSDSIERSPARVSRKKAKPNNAAEAAEAFSSPSSATGRRSANSPRSEARSPLTSPEETAVDLGESSQSNVEPRKKTKDGKSADASAPAATEKPVQSRKPSELKDVSVPGQSSAANVKSSTSALSSTDKQAQSGITSTPTSLKSGPQSTTTPAQVLQPNDSPDNAAQDTPAQDSPMNMDKPLSSRELKRKTERSARTSSKNKITKRRSNRNQVVATITSSKATARRREAVAKQYSKTNKYDYFRLQIVREVLNSAYGQDLQSLLSHCNTALKSSEWMLLAEEDLYRIILQRVHHLQNTQRWPLRQPGPSEEPKPEFSHWDQVLQDAKWLRTDFREERKQKIAVAFQLARWCAEWVHASPEVRLKLQIKASPSLTLDQPHGKVVSIKEEPDVTLYDDTMDIFATSSQTLFSGAKREISQKILHQLPQYGAVSSLSAIEVVERYTPRNNRDSIGRSRGSSMQEQKVLSKHRSRPEIPPADKSCALFWPESQPTRRRLTAPFVYKPPSHPMPPQGFYEHRPASQWTWEDDQKLRQNVKEYGANWHLIAHNMGPRQEFYSTSERRTPWECYERYLLLDPPQKELQTQYLKHFHFRIDKAHSSFDEQQSYFRNQAQQHASEVGRPPPNLPQKRFPTPMRVERKQNKRFLAMLDAARRLARKRETALNKQEKSQQASEQAQKPVPSSRTSPPPPPQYFSQMKAEKEAKEYEKLQAMKEQQKAMMDQQKRQANYQASLTNGIGHQMRSGMASNQTATNGHLAVPNNNKIRAPQNAGMSMGLSNGLPTNAQMAAMANQSQSNLQNQQRLLAQMQAQNAANPENIARLMQQAAQRTQMAAAQFARGSPNMPNAMPNLGMIPAFNGNSNNQFAIASADVNNTNMGQGQNNANLYQAQQVAQALSAAAAGGAQASQNGMQNIPQALSSGHVPHIGKLQAQIRQSNPNFTEEEARMKATEILKQSMRRSALNAASGVNDPRQQQGGRAASTGVTGGSQSPYLSAAQMQMPYQQNGMITSAQQGGSQSPQLTNAAQQPTPQQQLYQAQLRQQIFQQQQRQNQQTGSDGNPLSGSPPLGSSLPNNMGLGNMGMGLAQMAYPSGAVGGSNRTPTPSSMRPGSRAASGMDFGSMQPPEHQPRPGSSAGVSQSPRPPSSQGLGGGNSGS